MTDQAPCTITNAQPLRRLQQHVTERACTWEGRVPHDAVLSDNHLSDSQSIAAQATLREHEDDILETSNNEPLQTTGPFTQQALSNKPFQWPLHTTGAFHQGSIEYVHAMSAIDEQCCVSLISRAIMRWTAAASGPHADAVNSQQEGHAKNAADVTWCRQ